MSIPKLGSSVSNWNPGAGPKQTSNDKLMSTEASDAKDTMKATNELKAWVGGSGHPPAPYGNKSREF